MAVAPTHNYIAPCAHLYQGCPSKLTHYFEEVETIKEERLPIVRPFTTMRLLHSSATGVFKAHLPLKDIHDDLRMASLAVYLVRGASNTFICKVSFDCLIVQKSGEYRKFITFDLKIPGTGDDDVLSYEMLEKLYGSKAALYAALKDSYEEGRRLVNPLLCPHGQMDLPYDGADAGHDQFIRHTEQLYVAYLKLPQASTMLLNRLVATIRAQDGEAIAIKIYGMALHGHSTKTCCANCEYALVALMNEKGRGRGFLDHFERECGISRDNIKVNLPKKTSKFRVLVTVVAGEHDSHHRRPLTAISGRTNKLVGTWFSDIPVRASTFSRQIFETRLEGKSDERELQFFGTDVDLFGKTIGISGSLATKGSPATKQRLRLLRNAEGAELAAAMRRLML